MNKKKKILLFSKKKANLTRCGGNFASGTNFHISKKNVHLRKSFIFKFTLTSP